MTDWQVITGDCLDILPTLEAGSVDAIITDLPYGTTACAWDTVIPFEPMWAGVKHVLKPRGVFVTTASQPFTSALVMSNPKWFRYELVWLKNYSGGFPMAKYRPMKYHENIVLFSEGRTTYNPQYEEYAATTKDKFKNNRAVRVFGGTKNNIHKIQRVEHDIKLERGAYPKSYQYIKGVSIANRVRVHPTQKPVALYEYLIKTYTNEGELVLDITAGSGTTGVACVQTNRRFIGIEIDPGYANIARERIAKAAEQARQLELNL